MEKNVKTWLVVITIPCREGIYVKPFNFREAAEQYVKTDVDALVNNADGTKTVHTDRDYGYARVTTEHAGKPSETVEWRITEKTAGELFDMPRPELM